MFWAGGVAEVVEHLPGKHKALSSNPDIYHKKKKHHVFIDKEGKVIGTYQ
jgi:hypothetical protein